jgi:hypothetical protein
MSNFVLRVSFLGRYCERDGAHVPNAKIVQEEQPQTNCSRKSASALL